MPRSAKNQRLINSMATISSFAHNFRFRHYIGVALCLLFIFFLNSNHLLANAINNKISTINSSIIEIFDIKSLLDTKLEDKIGGMLFGDTLIRLQMENNVLKSQSISRDLLKHENDKLKALLNFQVGKATLVASTTLIKSSLDLSHYSFLLPIGTTHGIEEGFFVVDDSSLIGKIVEATENFSRVEVTCNKNAKTPGLLVESNQHAIITGDTTNQAMMRLFYTHNEDTVLDGELLVTTSDGLVYPYGLHIGRIKRVGDEILVEPLYDLSKISMVKVYKRS